MTNRDAKLKLLSYNKMETTDHTAERKITFLLCTLSNKFP